MVFFASYIFKTKRAVALAMLFVLGVSSYAQEGSSVFSFLKLPVSSHAVALGGQGSAVIANDVSLSMCNPALMMSVEDRAVNLGFMTYMQGTKVASAAYVQPSGELGSWGVGARYLSYGSAKETDVEGNVLGSFTPIDLALSGGYSRVLGEHWVAGAMGKLIYSGYGSLSSLALALDVGVNYYDEERDLSVSAVMRNIGVQLKAFGDNRERLPFDVELGLGKKLGSWPAKVHVSLVDLQSWKREDFDPFNEKISFGKLFINHVVLGVEVNPIQNMYVAMGYSFRRAYELGCAGSSHAAGLSFGAGIHLKRLGLGISWAKYHVSASTLAFSAQYSF